MLFIDKLDGWFRKWRRRIYEASRVDLICRIQAARLSHILPRHTYSYVEKAKFANWKKGLWNANNRNRIAIYTRRVGKAQGHEVRHNDRPRAALMFTHSFYFLSFIREQFNSVCLASNYPQGEKEREKPAIACCIRMRAFVHRVHNSNASCFPFFFHCLLALV